MSGESANLASLKFLFFATGSLLEEEIELMLKLASEHSESISLDCELSFSPFIDMISVLAIASARERYSLRLEICGTNSIPRKIECK